MEVVPETNFTKKLSVALRSPRLPSLACVTLAVKLNGPDSPDVFTLRVTGFVDYGTMVESSGEIVSVPKPTLPCTEGSEDVSATLMGAFWAICVMMYLQM